VKSDGGTFQRGSSAAASGPGSPPIAIGGGVGADPLAATATLRTAAIVQTRCCALRGGARKYAGPESPSPPR